jgi:hypothetical protein
LGTVPLFNGYKSRATVAATLAQHFTVPIFIYFEGWAYRSIIVPLSFHYPSIIIPLSAKVLRSLLVKPPYPLVRWLALAAGRGAVNASEGNQAWVTSTALRYGCDHFLFQRLRDVA